MATRVSRVVPSLDNKNLYRVIGSTDVAGQGTAHAVGDVNPFVLFDDAKPMNEAGLPPFGLHPHHGLQVGTLTWKGRLESQLAGENSSFFDAPETAVVFAGRGMAHQECSATDDTTELSQLVWMIPEKSRTKPHRVHELKPAKWATIAQGVEAHIVVGEAFGIKSEVETETKVTVVQMVLQPGADVEFVTIKGGAFVYPLDGALTVDKADVPAKSIAVLTNADGAVPVYNTSKEPVRLVLANGEKIDEPWVKLLFQNGFIIARDEEAARKQETICRQVGLEKYGKE